MAEPTIELTKDEANTVLAAVGIVLNMLAVSITPGQPASPQMLALEAVQAKLMRELGD